MELEGYKCTWERCRDTEDWIEVRLDRAMASSCFLKIFTVVKLTNLEISTSDHSPIFTESVRQVKVFSAKCFKLKNAWIREPMYQQIVQDIWNKNWDKSFEEKMEMCLVPLSKWEEEITVRSTGLYKQSSKELKEIYSQQEIFGDRDLNTMFVRRRPKW